MHKKKIQALMVAGLLSVGVIGGTLAWFTSTDSVKNEFKTGSVNDNDDGKDSGIDITEDFKEDEANNMIPGNDVNKDVQVVNRASYDQFIRVKFDKKFVSIAEDGTRIDLEGNKITIEGTEYQLNTNLIELMFTTHLKDFTSATNGDWVYADGYYYYIGAVAAEGTKNINNWTNTLLDSVILCKTAGNEYKNIGFDVDVISESIQATNNAVNDWTGIPQEIKEKLALLQTDIEGKDPVAPFDAKENDGVNDTHDHSNTTHDGCILNHNNQ